MWKNILLLTILAFAAAGCGSNSATNATKPAGEPPMPVGALMNEYAKSKDATVAKYTGKTLTVRGYTMIAPLMPKTADETGILGIMEKGGDMLHVLTCKFAAGDKQEFAQITGDQMVIVRGVFTDDMSTALTSCKLIEVE